MLAFLDPQSAGRGTRGMLALAREEGVATRIVRGDAGGKVGFLAW